MIRKYVIILVVSLICLQTVSSQNHFKISRLDINSRSKELAPSFFRNGLVFCSDRRSDFIVSYHDYDKNPLTNLYFSEKKKNLNFEIPRLLAKELTTFMFEGPATFNHDGTLIYFTRSIDIAVGNRNRNRGDTTYGIFMSRLVNGQWSQPIPFEYNSAAYNTGYPHLSGDGSQLFFCSDNPEGMGGFDIYVSTLRSGKWSKPENLGPEVNTGKNEVFPFYHSNGRLYFASRGLNPKGDLDIYHTMKVDDKWQKPVRMSEPFNSPQDDYGVIFSNNQDTAYFVSDRHGSADIYAAVSTLPTFTSCNEQKENDYCYVFYESNNNEIDTTAFAYEWDLGDGTLIRALEAEHCFARPDTYHIRLNIVDKMTQDVLISQAEYEFVVEQIVQPYITVADTVWAGQEITPDARESFLPNFRIENYYWDFGDGSRSQGIEAKYTFPLPGTYNIVLGLSGKVPGAEESAASHCITRKIVVLNQKN